MCAKAPLMTWKVLVMNLSCSFTSPNPFTQKPFLLAYQEFFIQFFPFLNLFTKDFAADHFSMNPDLLPERHRALRTSIFSLDTSQIRLNVLLKWKEKEEKFWLRVDKRFLLCRQNFLCDFYGEAFESDMICHVLMLPWKSYFQIND